MLECNGSPLAELEVDVYESVAISHMSPTRKHFVSLTQTTPCQIKALTRPFSLPLQWGELWVSIPNENNLQKITLREVLYGPDFVFTLVFLSQCDMARYSTLIKDHECMISNSMGTMVSQVPLISGLYKHVYTPGSPKSANAACTTQMIAELHQCMGTHITMHNQRAGEEGKHHWTCTRLKK